MKQNLQSATPQTTENSQSDTPVLQTNKSGKKAKKPIRRTLIGGQALMEGVMMRGRSAMAMAVRAPDGSVMLETKRLKGPSWYNRVPIVRGVVAFVQSLITGIHTLMRSAEVSSPDEETPGKGAMAIAVVLGVVLAVGLFMVLPWLIDFLLFDKLVVLTNYFSAGTSALLHELIKGVIRVGIFVLYLFLVSRMRDIKRTFMYHGAEHRTINCFEHGYEMTVDNVQKCSTRHNRCGTTFLFFVMVVSILVLSLVSWGLFEFGVSNKFLTAVIRIAFVPLVAGLSYELLRGLALMPDNPFTNFLRAPGLALQRLTTYPPEDDMAEIAIKSFLAVYNMDADPKIEEVRFGEYFTTALRKEAETRLFFLNSDESEAQAEADWILCEALQAKRGELGGIKKSNYGQFKRVNEILERREKGEPLDYILGKSEFYGYKIKVTKDVLIPRMETEELCEMAIKEIGDGAPRVLDLCTGSGCIALTLSKNTNAQITASDVSEKALAVAKENFLGTSVKPILSDLFIACEGQYDIVVCNPPYIPQAEIFTLAAEVKAQPYLALSGGADGLEFYRRIAGHIGEFLTEKGVLLLEIGYNQAEAVRNILANSGIFKLSDITVFKDINGLNRIVRAQRQQKGQS